ncbi:MAG: ABC transporter substrate-binding protein [Christensenellales bacterium]
MKNIKCSIKNWENRIISFFCVCALAASLVSCANTEESKDTITAETPSGTQAITAIAEPVRGGALNVAIPAGLTSFHPLDVTSVEWLSFLDLIYESPLSMDSSGKLSPSLAENWTFDDASMTWTFNIRQGVLWHGTEKELTADDVVYTLDCLREDPAHTDSVYKDVLEKIESYAAPSTYALQIKVTEKGALFLYSMVFPVISREYGESAELPVGTGPYKAVSCNLSEKVELAVNEKWWKEQPYIEKVTGICFENNAAILEAYRAGTLDVAYSASLSAGQFQQDGITETKEVITRYYNCMIPNIKRKLTANVNIRKAISYAIDRSELTSRVYLGHAVAADMPVISGEYLYNVRNETYEYNKNKAMGALEQEGYYDRDNNGLVEDVSMNHIELKLLVSSQGQHQTHHEVALIIQEQLKDVGISIIIDEKNEADYRTALEGGDFDLVIADFYLSRTPDWSYLLVNGSEGNYGDYSNVEIEGFQSAVNSSDEKGLPDASAALQKFFLKELPHIGLYFQTKTLIYSAKLQHVAGMSDPNLFHTLPQWYWSK